MSEVGILSALLGGLLTFLAPCTFPLIPAYIGFLAGGGSREQLLEPKELQRRIMLNALLFVLGFTSVFVFFGLISGSLGTFFALNRLLFARIGGAIVVLFGLFMLRIIRLPSLFKGKNVPAFLTPGRPSSAFFLGFFFGFGWSPCLGPILGTILFLAGSGGTASYGAFLLLCYSLGLAIPFLIVAYLYGTTFSYVIAFQKYLPVVEKVAGVFLIVIGVMLMIGQFGMFNVWVGEFWKGGWYENLMNYM